MYIYMDKSEVGMVAQRVNKPLIKTLKSPTLKCLGGPEFLSFGPNFLLMHPGKQELRPKYVSFSHSHGRPG